MSDVCVFQTFQAPGVVRVHPIDNIDGAKHTNNRVFLLIKTSFLSLMEETNSNFFSKAA